MTSAGMQHHILAHVLVHEGDQHKAEARTAGAPHGRRCLSCRLLDQNGHAPVDHRNVYLSLCVMSVQLPALADMTPKSSPLLLGRSRVPSSAWPSRSGGVCLLDSLPLWSNPCACVTAVDNIQTGVQKCASGIPKCLACWCMSTAPHLSCSPSMSS